MKHKLLTLAAALTAVILSGCCGGGCKDGKNYKIRDGVIVFNEPKPSAGQQDMLQFAADPMDTVRVGFIGLGMRGLVRFPVSPTLTEPVLWRFATLSKTV